MHASHLPPFTLKLNLLLSYPLILASFVCANTSLIESNTPTYVAGLLLGVLPIGSWLIFTTLSTFSSPLIVLYLPGLSLELYILLNNVLPSISFTSVLLPLPDTPVTQMNLPRGKSTLIFLRLFSVHPVSFILLPFPFLLLFGISIFSLPLKYLPVIDSSQFIISSTLPSHTKYPPSLPACGPISTI